MGHSEQNNTRIDKSYRNGSNATNAIMVQQIVRTCIVEPRLLKANNCNSQVKTKNILFIPNWDYLQWSAWTSAIQKEIINILNAAWGDGTKNKYGHIFGRQEKELVKGTTIQCWLIQI